MRLPNIPSNQVTAEQRPLFDKLHTGIRENLQGFTTQKPDGSLIGPFSALLHFPAYGTAVWDLFLALARQFGAAKGCAGGGDPGDRGPIWITL
jgi:hypothetical protein